MSLEDGFVIKVDDVHYLGFCTGQV